MAKQADYCIVPSQERLDHLYGENGEWLDYEYRDGQPDWNKMSEEEDEWFCNIYNQMLDKDKGDILNTVIKWQRGDGYAVYQVVEVLPRSVVLAFVDMGDAYQVEPELIRGLRKQDVIDMVEKEKSAARIFGRAKTLKERQESYSKG